MSHGNELKDDKDSKGGIDHISWSGRSIQVSVWLQVGKGEGKLLLDVIWKSWL
jgi:hypothetical protein